MGNTSCERRKLGDADCVNSSDCQGSIANSMCEAGSCVCSTGFTQEDDYNCTGLYKLLNCITIIRLKVDINLNTRIVKLHGASTGNTFRL